MTTFAPSILTDEDLATQGEALLETLVEEPTIEAAMALHALGKTHYGTEQFPTGGEPSAHFLRFAPLDAPDGAYWLESSCASTYRLILVAAPIVVATPAFRMNSDRHAAVTPVVETFDTGGGGDSDHLLVRVTKGDGAFTLAFTDESPVGGVLDVAEKAAREAGTAEEVEAILSAGTYAAAALMFVTGVTLAEKSPALR